MERFRRPARGQHHQRWVICRGEAVGNGEAVHPRQLDVEQNDLRPQPASRFERGLAVRSLTDHLEAVDLEQRPYTRSEVGVVVDDQQAPGHETIVSSLARAGIGVVPSRMSAQNRA